jgi:hypothetical protein
MEAFRLATGTNLGIPKQRISQQLIEKLVDLKKRLPSDPHAVSRGRALSPQLIAAAAVHMLACCSSSDQPPPAELVRLFAILHKLEVAGRAQVDEYALRRAATHEALHPEASLREIADAAGVSSPNTVRAWRDGQKYRDFRDLVKRGLGEAFWPGFSTDEEPLWKTNEVDESAVLTGQPKQLKETKRRKRRSPPQLKHA